MTKQKAKRDDFKQELQDTLNNNETLIESLTKKGENLKFNLTETDMIIEAVLDTIIKLTDEHDELALVGFGNFKAVERASRNGRNPSTGESLVIEAKRVPKFKAGKKFNDVIEGKQ